jgi:CDP-diacylglycerol--serine O-phosphatidyltransferase
VLLVGRPGRRRTESASGATTLILPERAEGSNSRRVRVRRRARTVDMTAPVSPALPAPAGGTAQADALSIPLLPGDPTLARRIRFAVVNACTVSSLLLGMSAIFLAFGGHVRVAAFALVGCVVFDGLDGSLARKLGVSTPFGAQMDSLADMCSFGIATPVVAYTWLSGDAPDLLVGASCALVAVCAALRLARFNVSPKNGNYFCGVPTTIAAAIMALSVVLNPAPGPWPVLLVGALALLMVSTFPYVKLSRILRLPAWVWLVPMAGAMIDVPGTFTLGVALYLASGPILWVRERGAVATV